MNSQELAAEIDEVIRTEPPNATRRHDTPENRSWLGRASNVIGYWDSSRSAAFEVLVRQFHSQMAREANEAFGQMLVLLHQAQVDVRFRLKRFRLEAYRRQLEAQDEVIRNAREHEMAMPIGKSLAELFEEITQSFPETNLPGFHIHGSPNVLRSQIASAIQKISLHTEADQSGGPPSAGRAISPVHPELVFVIHGRQLLSEFHIFLRAIGLKPLEWSDARRRTSKPNPYTWEVVDIALKEAGAIVALLTPDDEARLRQYLWEANENAMEKQYLGQPRQNVLFEAGVAYGRDPQRTLLLRVGSHRPMSDLSGHHIIQLDDSAQSRQDVANALRNAGCPVDLSGSDWFKHGGFSLPEPPASSSIEHQKAKKDSAKLRLFKTHIKGFTDLQSAAETVAEIHVFFESEPEYLNEESESFLQKYPRNFRQQLSFNSDAMTRWSLDELKCDIDSLRINAGEA